MKTKYKNRTFKSSQCPSYESTHVLSDVGSLLLIALRDQNFIAINNVFLT